MKRIWVVSVIFGAVLTVAIPTRTVQAQEGLAQLAARFVQWALSIPNDVNPLAHQTGDFCMVGQQGSVWFLSGFFGENQTVTRDCKVPEGVTIFFPVINGFAFNTPGCGQDTDLKTVQALKQFYFDFVTGSINKLLMYQQHSMEVQSRSSVSNQFLSQWQTRRGTSLVPMPAALMCHLRAISTHPGSQMGIGWRYPI